MILFNTPETENKIYTSKEFENLEGFIHEDVARVTLAKYLYYNIGLTVELLLGIKIYPFQEIILRSWFDKNFSFFVCSRGGSKSFLSAIFCCLYPVFFPDSRIVLTSNSFRSTRRTIQLIERFINSKGAGLLRQCYTSKTGRVEMKRHSDEYVLSCGDSAIIALPLNDKIRGQRAEILICDEFLSITQEMFKGVLLPFLTAGTDIQEKITAEQNLEKLNLNLSEEDRDMLAANKKLIALTSASFQFEYCYQLFSSWVKKIDEQSPISKKYFVVRMSYEALPESLVEKEIVEEAKSGGADSPSFQREFMARFASASDSYFNIKKLHENTIPPGDLPCVQLKGSRDSKYILACDPSFSSSKASDLFGMCLYLLDNESRSITQVNSYGKAGADLKDHIEHLAYLLMSFNIVFIIADLGGANFNFVQSCNESGFFQERGLKLGSIEGDFNSDDHAEELIKAKNSYNLLNKTIVYRQIFNSDWIRKSNEHLQTQIHKNKVKFASPLAGHEEMLARAMEENYPVKFISQGDKEKQLLDFISEQDYLIEETKNELALIECKPTPMGSLQFDLPQHLRRSKNPARARKDLYSCLLMGCWGARIYWDFSFAPSKKSTELFIPRLI